MEGHENATDSAHRRRTSLSGVLEASMWAAALVGLGLAAWMWADGWLYQKTYKNRSLAELPTIVDSERSEAPTSSERPAPIADGTPIARIEIPRLGLSPVVVAEGFSDKVLRRAIGHLPTSALPAQAGNVVLAGHRDTFFRPLEGVRVGDLVILESGDGTKHHYEVEWTEVVEPTAVQVVRDAGYPALTLITCYPFRFVGSAPQRFIVRARRVDQP
jgi:sortase A